MSIKKTLFLAVLLLAGLGYIYWVEMPRSEKEAAKLQPFADLSAQKLAKVEITKPGGTVTLVNTQLGSSAEKKDEGASEPGLSWTIEGVEGSTLDNGALTSLVSALENLQTGTAIPKDEVSSDLSLYGLAQPELSVRVETKGENSTGAGRHVELDFGKKNEYLNLRYVRMKEGDEENLFLVGESLLTAANKSPFDFRRKNLVSFAESDVAKIRLESENGTVVLARAAGEEPASRLDRSPWIIEEPRLGGDEGSVRAGEEAVSELQRHLKNLRAAEFFDGEAAKDLSSFGLEQPKGVVTVEFTEGVSREPLTVRFGQADNRNFFQVGPVPSVQRTDAEVTAQIFKPIADIREQHPLRFVPAEVEKVTINRKGAEVVELRRSGASAWVVNQTGHEETAGDTVFIEELLRNLTNVKAAGFPTADRPIGFDAPEAGVRLYFKEAPGDERSPEVVVQVGGAAETSEGGKPSRYYARVGEGKGEEVNFGQAFLLVAEDLDKITPRREVLVPVPTATPTPGASEAEASPPES